MVEAFGEIVLWVDVGGVVQRELREGPGETGSLIGARVATLPFIAAGSRGTVRDLVAAASRPTPPRSIQLVRTDGALVPGEARATKVTLDNASPGVELRIMETPVDHSYGGAVDVGLVHLDRLATVGRLTVACAHDLKNLLHVIAANASTLARALPADGARQDLIEELREAAYRATELARQVLSLGNRPTQRRGTVDLARIVDDMQRMLATLGGTAQLVIVRTSGCVVVHADRGGLEQALMNLVSNARDAMGGSGRITVSLTRTSWPGGVVTSGAHLPAGSYAVLSVADEGPGIEPELRPRLFEPFFTTKGQDGTGIGLAIVADVVHAAGGGVVLESEPGRGASFQLLLPLAPPEPKA